MSARTLVTVIPSGPLALICLAFLRLSDYAEQVSSLLHGRWVRRFLERTEMVDDGHMDSDTNDDKGRLARELLRIEESAAYSGQSQFQQAKFWRGVNLVVGVPASVLAAVSGAAGLSSVANRVLAAYLALGAAGLGALLTVLNTNRRTTQAHSAANAYLEVQTAARQLRELDLPVIPYDEARTRLQELTARRDEINKTADIPAFFAYWLGARNIKQGRQTYQADQQKGHAD